MESILEAKCPACGLSLPDGPAQRDKRCPECLRVSGEAVLMRPVRPSPGPAERTAALPR